MEYLFFCMTMISYYSNKIKSYSLLESLSVEFTDGNPYIVKVQSRVLPCSRTIGSTCNTVDKNSVIYMDVGAWAGGPDGKAKTTFGIVSGQDVFLCSWMNLCEEGPDLSKSPLSPLDDPRVINHGNSCYNITGAANAFFKNAFKKGRGHILSVASTDYQLTGDTELILILPDLHLHIQKNGPLDRFRYGPMVSTEFGPKYSLDDELRNLLDILILLNEEGFNTTSVQIGDMYDVWESEIILRYLLKQMYYMGHDHSHDKWIREHGGKPRTDFLNLVNKGYVPRDALLLRDFNSFAFGTMKTFEGDGIKDECVLVYETNDIINNIRLQHKELFQGKDKICTYEIDGNHDNKFINFYWDNYAEGYPREIKRPTQRINQFGPKRAIGVDGCIWMEHGHKYDYDNNDRDWWLEGRGFDLVHDLLVGYIDSIFHTGRSSFWTDFARTVADYYTDTVDNEMRLFTLLRADEIFRENEKVNVVVLGHTHTPCLIEIERRNSLFWSHPHAMKYYQSEKCLKKAEELARSIVGSELI